MRTRFPRTYVADALTLCNALAGFLAMTYVEDGRFTAAALFILLAVLLDGLDGAVARRWGTRHEAGGRIADAFADAVSFCLAPALFLYALVYDPVRGSAWQDPTNALAVVASTLVAAFGLLRLLRFTEADFPAGQFRGLPTPASAIFLVSVALLFGPHPWDLVLERPVLVLVASLLSSFLMVTEIPYPKVGDGLRAFAAAGAVLAVVVALPVIAFRGGTSCTLGAAGCPILELVLFAIAFGIMVAYIVGGPWYVRVGSRRQVVSVQ